MDRFVKKKVHTASSKKKVRRGSVLGRLGCKPVRLTDIRFHSWASCYALMLCALLWYFRIWRSISLYRQIKKKKKKGVFLDPYNQIWRMSVPHDVIWGVLLSASSCVAFFLVRLPSRLSLGAFACLVCVCSLWVVALLAFFRSTLL